MDPVTTYSSLLALDAMSPHDAAAVSVHAQALLLAAQCGQTQLLLRGKNIGLLCEADDDRDAALLSRSALDLGAKVAQIRPSLSELSTPLEVQHTARMLGRLYDAVVCQGMAPSLVQQVRQHAGVPVFNGVASWQPPPATTSSGQVGDFDAEPARRSLLQAALLRAIA